MVRLLILTHLVDPIKQGQPNHQAYTRASTILRHLPSSKAQSDPLAPTYCALLLPKLHHIKTADARPGVNDYPVPLRGLESGFKYLHFAAAAEKW